MSLNDDNAEKDTRAQHHRPDVCRLGESNDVVDDRQDAHKKPTPWDDRLEQAAYTETKVRIDNLQSPQFEVKHRDNGSYRNNRLYPPDADNLPKKSQSPKQSQVATISSSEPQKGVNLQQFTPIR